MLPRSQKLWESSQLYFINVLTETHIVPYSLGSDVTYVKTVTAPSLTMAGSLRRKSRRSGRMPRTRASREVDSMHRDYITSIIDMIEDMHNRKNMRRSYLWPLVSLLPLTAVEALQLSTWLPPINESVDVSGAPGNSSNEKLNDEGIHAAMSNARHTLFLLCLGSDGWPPTFGFWNDLLGKLTKG